MNRAVGERERRNTKSERLGGRDWGAVVIILAAGLLVSAIAFGSCVAKIEADGFHSRRAGTENAENKVGGCTDRTRGGRAESAREGIVAPEPSRVPPQEACGIAEPVRTPAQSPICFRRVTIHHTATSPDRPAERVRAIDADHRSRGWDGIGYHFLVAEDGTVFSGRPLDRQGAHVRGENEGNLGIAFIGTYTDQPPPEAALAAVRRLLTRAFETWGFGSEAVYFHRDLAASECPGPWDKGVLF